MARHGGRALGGRLAVGIVSAGAMLLGAAGVGGAISPSASLHDALKTTFGARSAYVQQVISLTTPGKGTRQLQRLSGTQTFSRPLRAAFTLVSPSSAGTGTQRLREVIDRTELYVEDQGTWYRESLAKMLRAAGISGSPSAGDPTDILGFLAQRGAKITRLGERTLGGAKTTEYRSVVDLDRVFDKLPDGLKMSLRMRSELMKFIGTSSVSLDVWVDRQGRLRREIVVLPLSASALDQMGLSGVPKGLRETVSLSLSRFGTPVHATPPASSQPLGATAL